MDRVTSHEELLRLSGGDPWVRWGVPHSMPEEVYFNGRVALIRRLGARPGFWVTPLSGASTADEMGAALEWLVGSDELTRTGARSVSVPQEHLHVAESILDLCDGGDWEWWWTTTPPPVHPLEAGIITLDDTTDAEEIRTFSTTHNPRVWIEIGTGAVARWLGIRDADGHLMAVGGTEFDDSGIPHLAGIVTSTSLRGQGLGEAITSALTRSEIAEHGVCTLGVFSDNAVALRLYARLGYTLGRAWSSRRLRLA